MTIDFTKYMTSEQALTKLNKGMLPSRYMITSIAEGSIKTYREYDYVNYEGDYSPEDMIQFLQALDKRKDWSIEVKYGEEIHAVTYNDIPYTEEEVAYAQAWVRDHPVVEGQAVTFRPFTKFSTEFKESYED